MSYAGLKFFATTALVLGSLQVAAAEPETLEAVKQSIMTPGYIAQLFAGLALVIGLIIVLAALFKRFGQPVMNQNPMRVLGGLSVGQRERLVLVQVGEEQILLGVAPGHVTKIKTLDTPIVDPSAFSQSKVPGLGQLFSKGQKIEATS